MASDQGQYTIEMRDRKIIHIDMDAFYASVEQRDNPDLRGKPVAVGGSRERGVVAAASYEARKFGVRSAMPSVTAKRQCPELIFVKPRFEVYKEISRHIRTIFADHTEIIEPLSLDEAYLDVTENIQGIPIATEIATMIRAKILSETGLTASAGHLLQQIPGEARLRPTQAERTVRHHASDGSKLRSGSVRRKIPWNRPRDERQDEWSRHLHGPGYA
jgi:DNA polymerase IV